MSGPVTFAQFAGGDTCLTIFSSDVVRVLASAYCEYLKVVTVRSADVNDVGREISREESASVEVSERGSEGSGVKLPSRLASSASSDARLFTELDEVRAKGCLSPSSDYTYSGPSADADGYCYLKLFRSEKIDELADLLGYAPKIGRVLALPADDLIADWRAMSVTGRDGVYHVAKQGMVPIEACLATTAARSTGWPVGSIGRMLRGTAGDYPRVLREKAPALSDVLAGVGVDVAREVVSCDWHVSEEVKGVGPERVKYFRVTLWDHGSGESYVFDETTECVLTREGESLGVNHRAFVKIAAAVRAVQPPLCLTVRGGAVARLRADLL